MSAPIQGYKIQSFVPEHLATDEEFLKAMRRRLEDLMRMQEFEQQTRVATRTIPDVELEDCPLRPGFLLVEAYVDVSEYDVEVPLEGEEPAELDASQQAEEHEPMASKDARIEAPVLALQHGVTIDSTQVCTTCGKPVIPHNYRHPITTT